MVVLVGVPREISTIESLQFLLDVHGPQRRTPTDFANPINSKSKL